MTATARNLYPKRTPVPRNNQVVVKTVAKSDEVSSGGIITPGAHVDTLIHATVVAVGPGGVTSDGQRVPIDLKPGDYILGEPGSGHGFMLGSQQYAVVPEHSIIVVIKREESALQ